MCLNIFVVVIPKEGVAGGAPPILLWVWHRQQNTCIILESRRVQYYSRCHTQKDRQGPARQSLFGYDNDKDLKVHFLVTQLAVWDYWSIILTSIFLVPALILSLSGLHFVALSMATCSYYPHDGTQHFFQLTLSILIPSPKCKSLAC